MNDQESNPLTAEQTAELLRLTLPLMTKHQVPVTPHNYAVWFNFVKGENPELKAEIQQLIDTKTVFSPQVNEKLFEKYMAECDVNQFQKIRGEMTELMDDLSDSLHHAGSEAQRFGGHLDGVVAGVQHSSSLDDIKGMLKELVEETRIMRKSTQLLHEHLEAKSREITLLQEELEQERKRASTDPLTGLANRRAFTESLGQRCESIQHPGELSLLMVDIDHFKQINDTHGHLIGDRVIRFLAQMLQQNTKGSDLAARYGGEEFVVMLNKTGLRGAAAVGDNIRNAVAEAKLVRSDNKQPLGQVTVSVGVAAFHPGEDPLETINRADQALYRSKQGGRNRVTVDDNLADVQNHIA